MTIQWSRSIIWFIGEKLPVLDINQGSLMIKATVRYAVDSDSIPRTD